MKFYKKNLFGYHHDLSIHYFVRLSVGHALKDVFLKVSVHDFPCDFFSYNIYLFLWIKTIILLIFKSLLTCLSKLREILHFYAAGLQ